MARLSRCFFFFFFCFTFSFNTWIISRGSFLHLIRFLFPRSLCWDSYNELLYMQRTRCKYMHRHPANFCLKFANCLTVESFGAVLFLLFVIYNFPSFEESTALDHPFCRYFLNTQPEPHRPLGNCIMSRSVRHNTRTGVLQRRIFGLNFQRETTCS